MKPRVLSSLLIGAGAATIWVASRMNWITVAAYDDMSGGSTHSIVGATWSTELMALTLVLAAAFIAGLVLRRTGRRIIGIVAAAAAIAASWPALTLLAGEPDPERAHQLLTTTAANQQANSPALLSEWAEITATSTHPLAAVIALIGAAVALFGSVLLAMRPGEDTARSNQYERKQARAERIEQDLDDTPDSGRVLWDAIDEDIDPTDRKKPE